MKAFIVLVMAAVAHASSWVGSGLPYAGLPYSGYSGALPYAGLPYAGYMGAHPYAGLPLTGYKAGLPHAGGYLAAPLPAPSSQFQARDEFGNLAYGYNTFNSAKREQGNAYGGVTGSYSYVDANGIVQTTNYIADGLGFRVEATNLPVAPVADLKQPIFDLVGPAPVEDTPEVAAARQEFLEAFKAAKGE